MNVLEKYFRPIQLDLRLSLKKSGLEIDPIMKRVEGFDGTLRAIAIGRRLEQETNFFTHSIFLKSRTGEALVEAIPGVQVIPNADSFMVVEENPNYVHLSEDITISGMIMSKGPFLMLDENETHIRTVISLESNFTLDIEKAKIERIE